MAQVVPERGILDKRAERHPAIGVYVEIAPASDARCEQAVILGTTRAAWVEIWQF
jgi:hypothetical protein